MNDREKLLAVAVAAMVVLWGADIGWDKYQTALEQNKNKQLNTAQQLSAARTATARGERALKKITRWQQQSLPTDPDIAKSLYRDWLQQQLSEAGLKVKDLGGRNTGSSANSHQQFTFDVNASGTLRQFTAFLHKFYSAAHLHRISAANLSPTEDRKSLEISLAVDALALADGQREDKLAEGGNEEFQLALEDIQQEIVARNLFATYQPPKKVKVQIAQAKPAETEDTEVAQAKFSGINYGQGGWHMTIRMEKTGKIHYFREGDRLEIGRFQGTIEMLDGNRRLAIIRSDGQRLELRLGQTLNDARPIDEIAS